MHEHMSGLRHNLSHTHVSTLSNAVETLPSVICECTLEYKTTEQTTYTYSLKD